MAVFKTYDFLPIRLPSTPAVANNWGSTELRSLHAIDVLFLASVAPRSSYDMRPNFSLQDRDPLVKVNPRPVCSSSAKLASRGRHGASRACLPDGQSTGLGYVGGSEKAPRKRIPQQQPRTDQRLQSRCEPSLGPCRTVSRYCTRVSFIASPQPDTS